MICKNCGEEFEPKNLRGRKREFCYKEECDKARKRLAVKKYEEKKNNNEMIYNDDNGYFEPITSNDFKECNDLGKDVIVCEKDITIDEGFGDLIQLARELGAIRFKLIEEIKKVNACMNNTNKAEQDLLHRLEFIEELSEKEAVDIAVKLKTNREDRRVFKNSYYLISSLLNAIPLKNPEKFVRKGIEMVKAQTYEPKMLKDLFEKERQEG